MTRTLKNSKFAGTVCSAPSCTNTAVTDSTGEPICNTHYLRIRNHGSYDLPERRRSRRVACANCESAFDKAYSMRLKRALGNQFCSRECQNSYRRQQSLAVAPTRFWKQVEKRGENECWPWIGALKKRGYGEFTWYGHGKRTHIAPRVAYELSTGVYPGKLFVCHTCDNPRCVNPRHLWLGTNRDNMADMKAKGRASRKVHSHSENHHKSKLTNEQVEAIRSDTVRTNRQWSIILGVTGAAIYNIRARKTWRHV